MLALAVVKDVSQSTAAADHGEVAQALGDVSAAVSAAEAQGLLCGMVCAGDATEPSRWIARVLDGTSPRGEPARRCLEALSAVFQRTRREMDDPEMTFELLLPGDGAALQERVEALRDWSRGLLAGLALGGLAGERQSPAEVDEFVADLAEFSRLDERVRPGEQAEADFAELVEYARMGTLLLREHLDRGDGRGREPSTPTVH